MKLLNNSTRKKGDEGEEIACGFLSSNGYEILERNYRFGKGEIDIIAKDNLTGHIVFIEVKSRENLNFGEAEFALTRNKFNQLRKMAELYLYDKNLAEADCRFDAVAIFLGNKKNPVINHIKNISL